MSLCLSAAKVKTLLKAELAAKAKGDDTVKCGILRIGAKHDDVFYEQSLLKQFSQYGITPIVKAFPEDTAPAEVEAVIEAWNCDAEIKGILPLLPFPKEFSARLKLAPEKDIDGVCRNQYFYPCTPQAVMAYLKAYKIPLAGQKAVVLGRSPRVGKPLAELLQKAGAEVTVVHSQTAEPEKVIRANDLVFTAVGKPRFLNQSLLRAGQTIFDIGINEDPRDTAKICGDFDVACAEELNLTYTPVPGGIGSVTTLILVGQVLEANALNG